MDVIFSGLPISFAHRVIGGGGGKSEDLHLKSTVACYEKPDGIGFCVGDSGLRRRETIERNYVMVP